MPSPSRLADLFGPSAAVGCLLAAGVFGFQGCRSAAEAPGPDGGARLAADAAARAADEAAGPGDREPPWGNLHYRVTDARTGAPIPVKLTFVGAKPWPTPQFTRHDVPIQLEGAVAAHNRVFSLTGTGSVRIPQGRYDVWVTRGPEWSAVIRKGLSVAAAPVQLSASLSHVAPMDGWTSADFHVHAAPSWDSNVPLEARVYEFAAEGVDVIVSTDHNLVTDYAPVVDELGAGELLRSARGVEVTTKDWGHFGAFPLEPDPSWDVLEGRMLYGHAPKKLFPDVRSHAPHAVIIVNHPRSVRFGYFALGKLNPKTARFAKPGASGDFDAVEIMNGYQDPLLLTLDATLKDWFGLLASGRHVAATGDSDTHHLQHDLAGYPRNYVRVRPGAGPDALAEALRAGHAFFTSGPLLQLDVGGKSFGDLVVAKNGRIDGHFTVRAAPWIDVDHVRLYVGGKLEREWAVPPGAEVRRFEGDISVSTAKDTFIVLRADGHHALGPSVSVRSRLRPVAIGNPVYVDADGDGNWRP